MILAILTLLSLFFSVECKAETQDLFGGSRRWTPTDWQAVDDRVRGGSSVSRLSIPDGENAVLFSGFLDTKTLGGAGFASQRSNVEWNLSEFDGILIDIANADGKIYALNLKNGLGAEKENGRLESTLEYKFLWTPPTGKPSTVKARWSDFIPYYRGRPVEGQKLDISSIKAVSIMAASLFEKQMGDFSLTLSRIAATNEI